MDIKRSDLKLYARRSLQGNWGSVIGATLICMGITYLFVLALDAVLFAALGSGVKTLIGIFSAACLICAISAPSCPVVQYSVQRSNQQR